MADLRGSNVIGTEEGDNILGLSSNDILIGNGGADAIAGNAGNDAIDGNAGNDVLLGGFGEDVLRGGTGNDRLLGGKDKDELRGGAGDDFLSGDEGADRLIGGQGDDVFYFQARTAKTGTDTIVDLGTGDVIQFDKYGENAVFLFTQKGANTHIQVDTDGDGVINYTAAIVLSTKAAVVEAATIIGDLEL